MQYHGTNHQTMCSCLSFFHIALRLLQVGVATILSIFAEMFLVVTVLVVCDWLLPCEDLPSRAHTITSHKREAKVNYPQFNAGHVKR